MAAAEIVSYGAAPMAAAEIVSYGAHSEISRMLVLALDPATRTGWCLGAGALFSSGPAAPLNLLVRRHAECARFRCG
jgi:hypothetical protein